MRKPLKPSSDFNVGDVVRGVDAGNQPFEDVVTQRLGPYSVMVGDKFTPTSLIDEIVTRFEPHTHQPGSSLFDGAAAYETHLVEEASGGVFD